MNRSYIGLARSVHNPAFAIVNAEGQLVFAEACERHLQCRNATFLPDRLPYFGRVLEQYVDADSELVVARSSTQTSEPRRLSRWWSAATQPAPRFSGELSVAAVFARLQLLLRSTVDSVALQANHNRIGLARPAEDQPRLPLRGVTLRHYEHALAHAATACFGSPFSEAVCAVVDGVGEGTSLAFYRYGDGVLTPLGKKQRSTFSLGLFYATLCSACGFDPSQGEHGKVLGLAPYGQIDEELLQRFQSALWVHDLQLSARAKQLLGGELWEQALACDPADLAATGQAFFEDCMQLLLNNLHRLGGSDNLVLTGGCAHNATWNGKILERTPFKQLSVSVSPGTDGTAVGAAWLAHRADHPDFRPTPVVATPYLGATMSSTTLQRMLRFGAAGRIEHVPGRSHLVAANAIAQGKLVGWIQGRAEFGPRALGNRSVLADPRQGDMKERFNQNVKFREEFHPLSLAILDAYGEQYFEEYQTAPYMERTLRYRVDMIERVPAVVHANTTGRYQSVRREWNERFYDLIDAFRQRTGIPLVLSTGFSVSGKPLAHAVEDAIAGMHTTGIDLLVIDDYVIHK